MNFRVQILCSSLPVLVVTFILLALNGTCITAAASPGQECQPQTLTSSYSFHHHLDGCSVSPAGCTGNQIPDLFPSNLLQPVFFPLGVCCTHTDLPVVPETGQVCSCLEAFGHLVHSAHISGWLTFSGFCSSVALSDLSTYLNCYLP